MTLIKSSSRGTAETPCSSIVGAGRFEASCLIHQAKPGPGRARRFRGISAWARSKLPL